MLGWWVGWLGWLASSVSFGEESAVASEVAGVWGDEVPSVGVPGVEDGVGEELPVAFVEEVVVAGAEQDEVAQAGRAAVFPGADVVGFASGGVDAAAGEAAVSVAGVQGGALGSGRGAGAAGDAVDVGAVPGEVVGVSGGVAGGVVWCEVVGVDAGGGLADPAVVAGDLCQ